VFGLVMAEFGAWSSASFRKPRLNRRRRGFDMFKFSFAFTIVATAWFAGASAFAQERGTPEQRAACTPDALQLCASYIPDPGRVESCLRHRKSDLSEACRAVFESSTVGAEVKGK
jgi:hypothetical protein